ncbi:unnamed protein product [Vitrella brassicaformis CCMP3155]|uniref:DUF1365 domain-containing protein n=1 Tax=Vitrella brassicaformis (strain CCMP3155) TaxID=1169540 RepID=A0A0G4EWP9_VITBC|nr:unnamed protein product [Vitrella brassicaformis CCMP3155]|eukprot:CEM03407.1 unnamed protein product [Vitrella brassicaformis CCMP3155]
MTGPLAPAWALAVAAVSTLCLFVWRLLWRWNRRASRAASERFDVHGYEGTTLHYRMPRGDKPANRFSYFIRMDLMNLSTPVDTWLVRFNRSRHLKHREGRPLNEEVLRLCQEQAANSTAEGAAVLDGRRLRMYVLTGADYLGYSFNPISIVFVCDDDTGDLLYLVHEVHNIPWLERTAYVTPVRPTARPPTPPTPSSVASDGSEIDANGDESDDWCEVELSHSLQDKKMHVSPFNPHSGLVYRFTYPHLDRLHLRRRPVQTSDGPTSTSTPRPASLGWHLPDRIEMKVSVMDKQTHQSIMFAAIDLRRGEFSLLRWPRSLLTVFRIHLEAFLLYVRGFVICDHPKWDVRGYVFQDPERHNMHHTLPPDSHFNKRD